MADTDDNFLDFDAIGHLVMITFIGCLFGVAGYCAYAMG
jgi:hypothetical protein